MHAEEIIPRTVLDCTRVGVHTQLCPTLRTHGSWSASPLCPRHFPGKNTGGGCHFLLQGIFSTKGSHPSLLCLLRWQAEILYHRASEEAPELGLVQHDYNTACYWQLQKCMFTFQKHTGEDGAWLTLSLVNEGEERKCQQKFFRDQPLSGVSLSSYTIQIVGVHDSEVFLSPHSNYCLLLHN